MRFIVMESLLAPNVPAPVTGRLSMPACKVGSGNWPAARADSAALSAPARAERVDSER